MNYITKDSGEHMQFSTGMRRDIGGEKPRFDLTILKDIPYEEQMITRLAGLLQRGAAKYAARNFELAQTDEELARFQESAFRHLIQWLCGDEDEDHAAAIWFNVMGAEMVKWKMGNKQS